MIYKEQDRIRRLNHSQEVLKRLKDKKKEATSPVVLERLKKDILLWRSIIKKLSLE